MNARHIDRIWLLGGLVVIMLLIVASWFLVISPRYADAENLRAEAEKAQTDIVLYRKQNAKLEAEKAKLPEYRAVLASHQAALPSDTGMPDFLRELQSSGDTMNVTVSGLTAADSPDSTGNIKTLDLTLTADGTAKDLSTFLKRLQESQPRAFLLDSANLSAANDNTQNMTLNLTLKAFVTKTGGDAAATPAPTTPAAK
ncbi:type 4a pilus biogenesis protein PilO [Krasilnikovia sp. M28-CT-15]|uniref:type 4a pilus biogenesis protein PilO n=1 Tax=Krasilnikovia sp. M28-CT-15 TaxID=3373540 RepID=UPI003876D1DD